MPVVIKEYIAEERVLDRALAYPKIRLMGSKYRLLPWIYDIMSRLRFSTALDAFSGSGVVSYLLKSMGKTVTTNDYLSFAFNVGNGVIANQGQLLSRPDVMLLTEPNAKREMFCEKTFGGIFFSPEDLRFLDNTWANLSQFSATKRSLAIAAMVRASLKKQPRGVFTVANDRSANYDDGRRDLKLTLKELFLESVDAFNAVIYEDQRPHRALVGDAFDAPQGAELVYLDPPYVPRRDDNCYIKRYHFVEGLSTYWRGAEIIESSRVKKLRKRFTPFSYRKTALAAFDGMFARYRDSILVLSYSSNGYPDLNILVDLMARYKHRVSVYEHKHRYHFGTHSAVQDERVVVQEYLLVGTD